LPDDPYLRTSEEIRAMDRRRYVPAAEGLESRELLASSTNLNTLFGFQVNTNLNIPITYQQKALRIQRLPYYLEKIRPGRFLPKAEMDQVKGALTGLMDVTKKPPSQALDNYNQQLRHVVPRQSLRPEDIRRLNFAFTAVLRAAHTPESSVEGLQAALNRLVSQVDTASPEPVFLATNDYTLVLQTALGVGRPMPPPILPQIAKNNGIQAGNQHIKTPLHHPTLTGTYHFHTHMQIIDSQGDVLATAPVKKNNQYKIRITTALGLGVHRLRIRAVDDVGHLSQVSRPFFIKVVPMRHHRVTAGEDTPKGPLGSKS
jgi:hypothetical protein